MTTTHPGYAIGILSDIKFGTDIIDYLNRIDETLAPFNGKFLIHGVKAAVMEGTWDSDLVVIEFPDYATAAAWYASPAYREIIPLRGDNSDSVILLADGVPADHLATDVLAGTN